MFARAEDFSIRTGSVQAGPAEPVAQCDAVAHPGVWQRIDLDHLAVAVADRGAAARQGAPSASWAWTALPEENSARAILHAAARRLTAVPPEAFVVVGRPANGRQRVFPRRAIAGVVVPSSPGATANDNIHETSSPPARARSIVRDMLFLAVLAATLFGAYHSGRMAAFQKVIVVPGPSMPGSVVT